MPRQKSAKGRLRSNPVGIASVATVEKLEQTFPVFEKLGSQLPEEREEACNSLANIVLEDETALSIVLNHPALKILVELLGDSSTSVKIAAAGALRNISVAGGEQSIGKLLEMGCSEYLLSTLTQVKTSDLIDSNVNALLLQEVALLANICEFSETVVSEVIAKAMGGVLVLFVDSHCAPDVKLQLGQLLHIITDGIEETNLSEVPQYIRGLGIALDTCNDLHLRSLIAGTLVNLGCMNSCPEVMGSCVLPIINASVEIDSFQALQQMTLQSVDQVKGRELLEAWQQTVAAQQLCLETLANICSLVETDEDGVQSKLPEFMRSGNIMLHLLDKTAARCCLDKAALCSLLEKYPVLAGCSNILSQLQLAALHCLGNMLLMLGPLESNLVGVLWGLLCRLCEEAFASQQIEMLEIITGNMWTLLRNTKSSSDSPVVATPTLMDGIIHLAKNGSVEIRTNTIGMLAFLGQQCQNSDTMKVLAECLSNTIAESLAATNDVMRLQMLVEALNTIFDLFAETEYNKIVMEVQLLDRLKQAAPALSQVARGSGKQFVEDDEELLSRLEDALMNVENFLAYKQEQF